MFIYFHGIRECFIYFIVCSCFISLRQSHFHLASSPFSPLGRISVGRYLDLPAPAKGISFQEVNFLEDWVTIFSHNAVFCTGSLSKAPPGAGPHFSQTGSRRQPGDFFLLLYGPSLFGVRSPHSLLISFVPESSLAIVSSSTSVPWPLCTIADTAKYATTNQSVVPYVRTEGLLKIPWARDRKTSAPP